MPTIRFRTLITLVAPPPFASRVLRIFSVSCLLVSLVFTLAPASRAYAASFVVNSLGDNNTSGDGLCTLREAIETANNAGNGDCGTNSSADDTITFSVSGTITLLSTLPNIVSGQGTLTINGGSAVTISGNNSVLVMKVNLGANLTLQNVTIANGTSALNGGGIYSNGTMTITNSTFSGNSANHAGGGIYNNGSTMTITNSTFSGNSANYAGGIYSNSTTTITNSTFSGNSATNIGGGIFNQNTMTITNSTFSGNSATSGGGGIYIYSSGTMTITNSTFSGNSAGIGGGIYLYVGTVTLKNTIVANSTSGGNCSGTITDGGNNLDSANTCGFTTNAKINTDPNLGALTGSPQYFPLNTGSPAIDAGTNTGCPTDSQNGVTRPADGDGNGTATCDIGSYEAPPVPAASACILSATFSGSAAVSNGNPYYLNCFYGQVFVDNGEGQATGGNHFQGSATITDTGFTVCIQVPAGYTAASPTCVTDSGGGRKDFGIRPIAQAQSQTTTGGQSVGATGGAFNCASRWTLTIPAGVLPDNSSLQCGAFDPNVTTGAPAGFKFMGQMINVLILDNTGAARRTFNPPLTVCVTYTDADVLAAGGDPNNFVIQTADIGGAWVTMTTTVNTTTQQVCATTDHLTLFELTTKVPTSLPVTGQDFTPFIIIAALLAGALAAGVLVRR